MRKSVHLSSLWTPALILFAPAYLPAAVFAGLLAANILIEYGYYKKWPVVLKTYGRLFGKMLRSKETDGHFRLSGSPYVLAAALCSCLLFSPVNAAVALAVMLISDTAAALIGRAFGKHKINNNTKSIEGAAAFFLFGLSVIYIAAFLFHPADGFIIRGAAGVFAAMWAEVYENRLKIDDNLSIPLIVGACLSL
ncbi:MAG: diacylglycerol/polyprenol kinase family protein [Alphaproteobacteria bacterium]